MSGEETGYEVSNSMGPYGCVPAWVLRALLAAKVPSPYICLAVYVTMNAIWANDGTCFTGRTKIAAEVGISVDAFDRAAKHLVAIGALEIQERYDEAGDRTSNLYILHSMPWGGGRASAATPHAGTSRKKPSKRGGRASAATGGRASAALTRPSRNEDSAARATSSHEPVEDPLALADTDRVWDGEKFVAIHNGVVTELARPGPDLFAAVAKACGYDVAKMTSRARGNVGQSAKELRGLGASEADVRRVAKAMRAEWGAAAVNPGSLLTHWPKFVALRDPEAGFVQVPFDTPPGYGPGEWEQG